VPRGLDAYSFPARVVPVLVVVLPPLVLLGGAIAAGTGRAIGASLVLMVLTALAAQVGRSGKRLEPELWQEWGGSPTLRRFRYRGAADAQVIDRLHRRIEAALGDPLPTTAEEQANPASADARYEEAIRRLIGMTRDRKRFHLLFAENVNYGMRRNLLGLRWTGMAVAAVTAIVAIVIVLASSGRFAHRAAQYGPGLVVAMLELLFWALIVSRDWVRVPAEAYGDRLIEAVDALLGPAAASDPETPRSE
jgi:hypothetical protein